MKKPTLLAFMLLATLAIQPLSYAQEEAIELSAQDIERISADLEKESKNKAYDKDTRRALKKVSKMFDSKVLDADGKPQKLNFGQKLGRTLGKGAAWVTTKTSKPFLNASGFLTGFFEKSDKNKDVVALYQFFLNHQLEFDNLYKEAGTPQEMAALMIEKSEEIVDKKTDIILKDFIKYLDPTIEIPEGECDISELDLSNVDLEKVKPDYINNHPEFLELKGIVGEITQQELDDMIETGYVDKKLSFSNYKAAIPKIHEGVMTVAGQIFIPKMVLGIISKSLASWYATPVILADVGTAVSSAICLSGKTQEKFEKDRDLASFCSYVVNKSSYELLKSRAKGYVAGKKLKAKVKKKLDDRKARRAAKKAKKNPAEVM
ncbi:MAG: hypothetical protein ACOVP4_02890 [Bacteriovoracaceae bacterium]